MREAMDFITARRPTASPNAGFAAALSDLEEDLHGFRTVKVLLPIKQQSRAHDVCQSGERLHAVCQQQQTTTAGAQSISGTWQAVCPA